VVYAALIADFVRAVEAGTIDVSECRELLRTHREPLDAGNQSHPPPPR